MPSDEQTDLEAMKLGADACPREPAGERVETDYM
jgi:hypothetical protein